MKVSITRGCMWVCVRGGGGNAAPHGHPALQRPIFASCQQVPRVQLQLSEEPVVKGQLKGGNGCFLPFLEPKLSPALMKMARGARACVGGEGYQISINTPPYTYPPPPSPPPPLRCAFRVRVRVRGLHDSFDMASSLAQITDKLPHFTPLQLPIPISIVP
jgi:hypothetical protein